MAKLYILLPVHNRRNITANFIDHLLNQSFQDFHLLLIDDGSTDNTVEYVKEKIDPDKLTVIQGKGNWWWAGSLQQGYKWFNSNERTINVNDFVLIINDDTTFENNFLQKGIELLSTLDNT